MSHIDPTLDAAALQTLRWIGAPPDNWVSPHPGIDHDVTVVGSGHTGSTFAFALQRAGIRKLNVIDAAADEAGAGLWRHRARMQQLRTPKNLVGPELGLPALGWSGRVLAAPAVQQRFLLVFLRGAYDATNTLVPYTSSFYQEVRPNIALARPGAGQNAALELSADWGLHPVLRESLLPMWRAKSLAFVPFSGLEDESRSHFQMQDKIEIGLGGQARDFSTGFLNRLVSELPQVKAASFTESPTPVLRGPVSASNIGLARAGERPLVDERQSSLIARMYQGNTLASAVQDGFATRDVVQRELGTGMAGREMSGRDMAGRDMASAAEPTHWAKA